MTEMYTGAELTIKAALELGVNTCFANPGTTEMPLVAALDKVEGMHSILCLFEGVCTGAADGYGRMKGVPAMTLLHLGPGFANGIANLHNARRAHTPIVNLVGDHASWHLEYDAPLTSDIHSLASPVSGWVKTVASAESIAGDFQEAVQASLTPPGCGATLVLPMDFQEQKVAAANSQPAAPAKATYQQSNVDNVAALLQSDKSCILLVGGSALSAEGQTLLASVAEATGAKVLVETYPARIERGQGVPAFGRLPYFPEDVMKAAGDATVVLVGTRKPIAYFGYTGLPSQLVDDDKLATLTEVAEDNLGALTALAKQLNAPAWTPPSQSPDLTFEEGKLTANAIVKLVTKHMPDNSIVVVEGSTCSVPFYNAAANGPRHTLITNTGGAIGQGPAVSVGCATACPDRTVINLQSDGSALYTIQSLWTQAREKQDVITLIVSNRRYSILQTELKRSGQLSPGPQVQALTELNNPPIDWVAMSEGFGVPAAKAETTDELSRLLQKAVAQSGPFLVEMVVE